MIESGGIYTARRGKSARAITDAAMIALITDPANWDLNGNYTGSTAGLVLGNFYTDFVNKTKYEFDGTYLIRYIINVQA